jgi:hypothetical protein
MKDTKLTPDDCEGCQFYIDWLFESHAGVPGTQKRCSNPYAGGEFWNYLDSDYGYPIKESRSQEQIIQDIIKKQRESPLHRRNYLCPIVEIQELEEELQK